jgi:hypothetical protein
MALSLRIAAEVMCVEDGTDAAQRVTGDSRDLSFRAAGDRKPRYSSSAEIVERDADETGSLTCLAPQRSEAIRMSMAGLHCSSGSASLPSVLRRASALTEPRHGSRRARHPCFDACGYERRRMQTMEAVGYKVLRELVARQRR